MYQLTEDQELLLQTVNEFGAQRLAPTVLQRDAANEFDESLVKELLDLGLHDGIANTSRVFITR